jgi:hypothetical protein
VSGIKQNTPPIVFPLKFNRMCWVIGGIEVGIEVGMDGGMLE